MEDFDIPIFAFSPLVIGLFLIIIIAMIVGIIRWPAIAPMLMMIGVQALGIVIIAMGFYMSGVVIYFVSFLAVLAIIVNSLFYHGKPLGFDTPSIVMLILMFLIVFGYMLAPNSVRNISMQKTLMFGGLGFLPFMLGRTFAVDDKTAWKAVAFSAWFSVLYSFYTAGIVLAGHYRTLGGGRFSGMGDPIGAGTVFGMAAIFMVATAWRSGTMLWKRVLLISGAVAAMLVTFATFSRGPFLAMFLGLLTMFLIGRKLPTKILLAVIIPIFLLVIFAFLAPEGAWERIVGRTLEAENVGSITTGRLDIYKDTISRIPESLILGHGTASFALVLGFDDKIKYPHNIFLEILYEFGLVGLLLFLIFIFSVLRRMMRFLKNDFLSISLRRVYVGLFVHSLLIFQFSSHIAERPAFWFVCGLISGPFWFSQSDSLELLYEEQFNMQEQDMLNCDR